MRVVVATQTGSAIGGPVETYRGEWEAATGGTVELQQFAFGDLYQKIITAFDVARTLALGADWCNSARGFMFALGCLQSQTCHTGQCPTGVATQDPRRQRGLAVEDKATRVFNFQQNTLKAVKELLQAAGLRSPGELGPEHIIRRVSQTEVRSLATLYPRLAPGELLTGTPDHQVFRLFWDAASAEGFVQPERAKT